MRGESMSQALQAGPFLWVIEQFPIEDHADASILIEDGLSSVLQTDDAEAAGTEGQAGFFEISILVGAAMEDRIRHRTHHPRWDGTPPRQVDYPRDTAHPVSPPGPGISNDTEKHTG
jgi:hypothetical protein